MSHLYFNYTDQPTETTTENLTFLAEWTTREWDRFLALMQTYRFDAGDYVYRSGDDDRSLFLVTAGQFEMVLNRPGDDLRIGTADIGSVLGEQTFLDSSPHSIAVRALTEGELVRFSYEAFEIFAVREPDLAR